MRWFMQSVMDTSAIIDRLGGTGKTAEICGLSRGTVSIWRQSGIPPRHWERIVGNAVHRSIPGVTYDALEAARDVLKKVSP